MPSIRKKETKAGEPFYEIRVSRGRNKSYLTRRWYPPDGWSQKAIDRELTKVAAEFERQAATGEVISKAEQKEKDLLQKQEDAKVHTLRKYGETVFMPAKAVTMSENGRSTYQGNLDHWIYPALGDLKMPDITPANISALLLSMQSQGKSHATCIKVYTILHSLFKMAYMGDAITRNPMDKVERPKPRKDELQGEALETYTPEEIQRIFSALENEQLKWRAMVHLLIDTGIRRGEACGLQWKDVDFKASTITIAGNLCYTLNSTRIITYILFRNGEVKAFINGTLEFRKRIHQRRLCVGGYGNTAYFIQLNQDFTECVIILPHHGT